MDFLVCWLGFWGSSMGRDGREQRWKMEGTYQTCLGAAWSHHRGPAIVYTAHA